jgi:translation initiation factor IF-3
MKAKDSNKARINEEITLNEVRLVGKEGEPLGVVSISEAMEVAEQASLDLVEISPNAEPPVCKVMDYGKFLFEKSKTLKEQKKKQKQIQVKEIKFRPGTDEGDYQVFVDVKWHTKRLALNNLNAFARIWKTLPTANLSHIG